MRKRIALLGDTEIELLGTCPQRFRTLPFAAFQIPAARRAVEPLTHADLMNGTVFVSTLPNISRYACAAQILGLEESLRRRAPTARLVHVSADHARYWIEVDVIHPDLKASGYSLHDADEESRRAFTYLFGVAVAGHHRIAHGMFAIENGVVVAAEIPYQQMGVPSVGHFVHRAMESIGVCAGNSPVAVAEGRVQSP